MIKILLCIGMVFNISCTKEWLDKKPDLKTTVPESLQDCQVLLDNNALFNGDSPALGEIASDGHFVVESRVTTMTDIPRNAYTWSNEMPYRDVPDWNSLNNLGPYSRIFTCNLILETLSKISINSSTQVMWNDIKGQALFQRARTFYELAQLFAPPYEVGKINDGLSIPLRLETDVNLKSIRSTVKQTYDLIVSDLNTAETLLPINPVYKTRGSKAAVYALLARIFLSMEDYTNSGIYADKVLSVNGTLLDYNKLNAAESFPLKQLNDEVIFHSTLTNWSENTSGARVDQDLISLYNANDLRNSVFFTNSAGQFTFKGFYNGARLCFNGLANDEMYLIRAECNARSGKIADAMNDVNTLLKNRFKKVSGISTYVDQIGINKDQVLDQVIKERKKELLFRGLRWSDLRRLNRDSKYAVSLSRIVLGKTYTLEPNSYKYTFPIPNDVIELSGMAQSPGWQTK